MNSLQKWMALATPQEKIRLSRLAGITRTSLQWIAGGYRTAGKLNATPDIARKLEIASAKVAREGLPQLAREDLCAACGRCEYAKTAR